MKNIVIIGGGTGTFTLLSGLRKFSVNNSVIVSSADDGGSTGRLRKEVGVKMSVGDIRQCLVGLSYTEPLLKSLFNYRFEQGPLSGHAVGNIILAALEKLSGNEEKAISAVAKILNVRGEVLPVTLFPTLLSATLQSGKQVVGEHTIDEPKEQHRSPIQSLELEPAGPVNPRALKAIKRADVIVFGPGDLFTSTLPNLLVKGVREALLKSSAKKIFIVNIMTKPGQTDGFKASDFVKTFQRYLNPKSEENSLDAVIVNTKKPSAIGMKQYQKSGATVVVADMATLKGIGVKVFSAPLLCRRTFTRANGDVLDRSFLRHDADKTAKLIWDIASHE